MKPILVFLLLTMKTHLYLLLGAGLVLTGPPTLAQQRADYAGIWLNTATYTQVVGRLDVSNDDPQASKLVIWEGLPANAARRPLGQMSCQPAPNGTVSRLVLRLCTADVRELYYLDLQPDGTLWVLRHVTQRGAVLHCDTMHFARWLRPGLVGRRGQRHTDRRPPAPPEVALRFTRVGVLNGAAPVPPLMAQASRLR